MAARHRRHGDVRQIEGIVDAATIAAALTERPKTLLLLEPPEGETLRCHFPGPIVGETCLGWLKLGPSALASYAESAAALLDRQRDEPSLLVLLGPREARYCELIDLIEANVALPLVRWSAERIRAPTMLRGLRAGPAAALFVGHGVGEGWMAYGGVTAADFQPKGLGEGQEPVAVIFSLACNTGVAGGFGDKMAASGAAGAIVAPIGMTLHASTRQLAPAIARSLTSTGGQSVDAALRRTIAAGGGLDGYVVIGDPGIPIRSASAAAVRCGAIFAPAPWASVRRS